MRKLPQNGKGVKPVAVHVSARTCRILLCCSITTMIVTAVSMGRELYRTRNFACVDARVLKVAKTAVSGDKKTNGKNDAHISIVWHMECEYRVRGRTYRTRCETLFPLGVHEGRLIKLYCSPDFPEDVRDRFMMEACTCGLIFLVLFTAVAAKFHSVAKTI